MRTSCKPWAWKDLPPTKRGHWTISLLPATSHPDGKSRPVYRKDYPADFLPGNPCTFVVDRKTKQQCGKIDRHKHIWGPGSPDGCYLLLWGTDDPINKLLFCEGEKAALACEMAGANNAGFTPVTWRNGTQSVDKANYAACLGREVVLWPDNDEAGHKAMATAAFRATKAGALSMAIVEVERLPDKADAADVSAAQVIAMALGAVPYVPPAQPAALSTTLDQDAEVARRMGQEFGIADGSDELARIAHFEPYRIMASNIEGGRRVLVAPRGYWESLDVKGRKPTGGLQIVAMDARTAASNSGPTVDPSGRLSQILQDHFNRHGSTSYFREVSRQSDLVARRPSAYGIPYVDGGKIDRRDLNPLFPLRGDAGEAWDFTTGQKVNIQSIRSAHLLDHNWEGAAPDFTLLNSVSPTGNHVMLGPGFTERGDPAVDVQGLGQFPEAEVMAWFIHNHLGTDFLRRLAYLIQSPRKQIDCLIMGPDAGKSTLFTALTWALGEGAVEVAKGQAVASSDRFTNGINFLAKRALVIADEADKVKEYPKTLVTSVCDDFISLELKGIDAFQTRRVGNLIFAGNDFPKIQFLPGVEARIPNCHILDKATAISKGTRARLLSRHAYQFLAAWLLEEGARMYALRQDGTSPQGKVNVNAWKEAVAPPALTALLAVAEEKGDGKVSGADLRRAVEDYIGERAPEKKGWESMVKQAFPRAVAKRSGRFNGIVTSGWEGIRLKDDADYI